MKKAICILLVFITSFQLSVGYSLAAVFARNPAQPAIHHKGRETLSRNHYTIFHFLNQLLKEKEVEEDDSQLFVHPAFITQDFYAFVRVFSARNKHFLIHYATSIKGKLPLRFLLHNTFLI